MITQILRLMIGAYIGAKNEDVICNKHWDRVIVVKNIRYKDIPMTITDKGQEVLQRCYEVARKVNDILLHDMSDDDAKLCIQLLRCAEARQSSIIFEMRDKPLDEVYEKVVGEKPDSQRDIHL